MARIQGPSGDSLSSQYDVRGGQVDINELRDHEGVVLVHNMADVLASERLSAAIRYLTATVNQSTNWNETIGDLSNISRIVGVQVLVNNAAHVQHCMVAIRNPFQNREIPIWHWDNTSDREEQILIAQEAAPAATLILQPTSQVVQLPSLSLGQGQPPGLQTSEIVFRGRSTAFGGLPAAVTCRALIHIVFIAPSPGVRRGQIGAKVASW